MPGVATSAPSKSNAQGVVRTLDYALAAPFVLKQLRAPMAARICEGAQLPGTVSNNEQRNTGKFSRKVVTGTRQSIFTAEEVSIP